MSILLNKKEELNQNGFCIIESINNKEEIQAILKAIDNANSEHPNFKKTKDIFAIRTFLNVIPEIKALLLNNKLLSIINECFGNNYFIVKSIYFNKPANSNWFVAFHQDLTISVDKKNDAIDYLNWTVKHDAYAVQPPLSILENNFTIRIHLDDTDENNGALKIIAGSHKKGMSRFENLVVNICFPNNNLISANTLSSPCKSINLSEIANIIILRLKCIIY